MVDIALATAIVGHIATWFLVIATTLGGSHSARVLASGTAILVWIAHLMALIGTVLGDSPQSVGNLAGFFLVGGWVVSCLHLYVWFRRKADVAGWVLPPVAAMAAVGALRAGTTLSSADPDSGRWLLVHISLSALALGVLCLAFVMSLLFLAQDRALKSRQGMNWVDRLPALREADRVGQVGLVVGFVLLTAGIASGFIVHGGVTSEGLTANPKQAFALLTWLIFAAVIAARGWLGIRGRRSAYMTIAGFALGILTVVGMVP
ncbi:MAG: cytochrome c biogenesis protein CcsA [Acidobacteriota bacterium]|nr:cytochrome c biogenesis protein CcsA [Acidobacteriota bacterium]MDH3785420.1 cytochrome c biogenesis protein CcsA [Acidobacteriota bacterium]